MHSISTFREGTNVQPYDSVDEVSAEFVDKAVEKQDCELELTIEKLCMEHERELWQEEAFSGTTVMRKRDGDEEEARHETLFQEKDEKE